MLWFNESSSPDTKVQKSTGVHQNVRSGAHDTWRYWSDRFKTSLTGRVLKIIMLQEVGCWQSVISHSPLNLFKVKVQRLK